MDVLMPQLGETVAEGKITKWFKCAGDAVKPGDNLFEIETDKTSMEVPATFAGTLSEIRFQVGETAKVGAVVAVIAGEGQPETPAQAHGDAGNAPPKLRSCREAAAPTPQKELGPRLRGDDRTGASFAYPNMDPFQRSAHARAQLRTGANAGGAASPRWRGGSPPSAGSISRASPAPGRTAASSRVTSSMCSRPRLRACGGASAAQVKALFEGVAYEEVPLDSMRRTIATRLIEAKQTIPHFYLTADIEIGRLTAMREEANAAAPKGRMGNLRSNCRSTISS